MKQVLKGIDMESCNLLMPHDIHISPNPERTGCILPRGHEERHLSKVSDGRYAFWEFAFDCRDQGCTDFPDCDCFDYEELSEEEAKKIVARANR